MAFVDTCARLRKNVPSRLQTVNAKQIRYANNICWLLCYVRTTQLGVLLPPVLIYELCVSHTQWKEFESRVICWNLD